MAQGPALRIIWQMQEQMDKVNGQCLQLKYQWKRQKHKQLCRKYANLSWKSKYSSTLISATRCTQTLAKKVTTTIEQSSWRRTPLHLRSTRRSCDAMTYSRAPSCARELSMLRKTGKTFAKNKTSLIFCEPLPQEAATKSNSGERIWESWTLFVHYSHIIAGGMERSRVTANHLIETADDLLSSLMLPLTIT